jgi:site-specific recombinase XerD
VQRGSDGFDLFGSWEGVEAANRFLSHLAARRFSSTTVRAYAFDLLNLARFLEERSIRLECVVPTDFFDWIAWQGAPARRAGRVVALRPRGAAPASINRRVAAVRAFFEYLVMAGTREDNPVPTTRRGQGIRPKAQGMLGHLGPGRARRGGRLVREQRRLPEAVEAPEVTAFLLDLRTHRDRAMVLAMVLGGLRAGEVRSLKLFDVDQARRQVRVIGKGGRERIVPIDRPFFTELAAYLREERPSGAAHECFVVLHGPTSGHALSESGLRSVFRHHRVTSGALRVRPHRLRHTYGTELAAAGIDLLVLRELMGHASPETTAGYVHLSNEHVAAEYAVARAAIGR